MYCDENIFYFFLLATKCIYITNILTCSYFHLPAHKTHTGFQAFVAPRYKKVEQNAKTRTLTFGQYFSQVIYVALTAILVLC